MILGPSEEKCRRPFSSVLPKTGELGIYPFNPIPQLVEAAPEDVISLHSLVASSGGAGRKPLGRVEERWQVLAVGCSQRAGNCLA